MNRPILELDHLVKGFDGVPVIRGITAEVGRGEVIGILGLNGAGKTTLLETALGLALPDKGSVELFGQPTTIFEDESLKHRIGFVPQQDELLGQLKARDFLDLISRFYSRWNKVLIDRLAGDWAVPMHQRIDLLSVGQRQKLSILAALGHEPELIVLDEPVASLDPKARRQFLQALIDIVADGSTTVLFSTHIVSDVERVASRVWIIKDGELAVDAPLDALKEEARLTELAASNGLPRGTLAGTGLSLEEIFLEIHQ